MGRHLQTMITTNLLKPIDLIFIENQVWRLGGLRLFCYRMFVMPGLVAFLNIIILFISIKFCLLIFVIDENQMVRKCFSL